MSNEKKETWLSTCFVACEHMYDNPERCDCRRSEAGLCPMRDDVELMNRIKQEETTEVVTNILNR